MSTPARAGLLLAALACGGGGESSGPGPGAFTVAASPAPVTLLAGSHAWITVTVTRQPAFTGSISLAAENLPAGLVMPGFPTIDATQTSVQVLLLAQSAPAQSSHTFRIRAQSTGQPDQVATINVNVGAAAPKRYSMSIAPATISLARGGAGGTALTITRSGGFADGIPLVFYGGPAGITYGVTTLGGQPNLPVAGTDALLLAAAAGSATPGTYQVAFFGLVPGAVTERFDLTLTVN